MTQEVGNVASEGVRADDFAASPGDQCFYHARIDFDLMVRTQPSPNRTFAPSDDPPIWGTGSAGSKGMSSGLVQGTSRLASTARIVFDNHGNVHERRRLVAVAQERLLTGEDEICRMGLDSSDERRIAVNGRHFVDQFSVVRANPGLVGVVPIVKFLLSR